MSVDKYVIEEAEYWVRDSVTGQTVSVDGRRVYLPDTISRGPICEAMQLVDDGVVTGWIAWHVDQFGCTTGTGKISKTFELAFERLEKTGRLA